MPTPFESGKTATELGIDTTRLFVVVNPRISYCNTGDILKLVEDDGSDCPYFKNLTSGGYPIVSLWERLAYADIAVHCPTQEDYDTLMKAYEEKTDWRWIYGQKPTDLSRWIEYKSETCVRYEDKFTYSDRQWYENSNCTIISLDTALECLGVEKEPSPVKNQLKEPWVLYKEIARMQRENAHLSLFGCPVYPISQFITKPKQSFMSDIATTLKNALLSKTDRILREHGLEDENGKITNEAARLMLTELAEARWLERREEIAKVLLKEEGKK